MTKTELLKKIREDFKKIADQAQELSLIHI